MRSDRRRGADGPAQRILSGFVTATMCMLPLPGSRWYPLPYGGLGQSDHLRRGVEASAVLPEFLGGGLGHIGQRRGTL
jgi:hypothetical protein